MWDSSKMALCSGDIKDDLAKHYHWPKKNKNNTVHPFERTIFLIRHGAGSVMLCKCFFVGKGRVDGKLDSAKHSASLSVEIGFKHIDRARKTWFKLRF